jgi:hypothetical protein
MLNSRISRLALLGMGIGLTGSMHLPHFTQPSADLGWSPNNKRAKAKPKQKGPNPLRGYYSRHAHSMHEYSAEKNLAKLANGQSGFKGFRKVRQYVKEIQGTAWVSV